ncbi:ATP-binding protein [Leptolyngbya sp. NIES-2104]|uniref:ATP-binding protein n=1 Tax=Leptolyngbya sp. NIES-2104 TaxID=1552121 RepID=UPI0006EC44F5|nr:ATP-binding protein [Leptolyngbya sp. NIES-2104]GAP95340.1 circadian input kinase A [Leptolyngbya sp. NIES-2104]
MTLHLHLHQTIRGNAISASLRQVFTESDSCATNQLAAELWIERFLNHLNARLLDCLNASPTEARLWQILADELGQALSGEVVAIALPIEDQFEVQHLAGSMMQLSPSICLSRHAIELEIGKTFTRSELQKFGQLEWKSAWELCDRKTTYGWLVTVSSPISTSSDTALIQLRDQCVSRVIAQTAQLIRHGQKTEALIKKAQTLEAKNRELAQTSKLKSEFLANTSHEIRTPLSSILGFTHLLREQGYTPSNLRHQEYLKIILSSGQHLLALINDILDLSKIEANQLTLQQESIDVIEVCKLALKLVQEKANDKGLPLKLVVAPDVSTVVADPLRLKQMLFNLLSNALKFTDRGSVGLEVKTVDQFVEFTVWDTGTGISLEQQQLLFRPYTQLNNATPGEGTGLGLALTQKLAELHGGWVRLESEPDRGSRFTIALPCTAPVSPTATPTEICPTPQISSAVQSQLSTAPRPNAARSNHILLVEDNAHNARLIITYLCKLGYEVTWSKNSEEMWQSLKQSLPAAILMDIHLPDVNGLTLTQQLRSRKRYRSIPVIVQTAMAMKGDREKCLAAGAADYVSKPIDLTALAQTVAKYSQKR